MFDLGGSTSAHGLVDCVVFGVYGKEGGVMFGSGGEDEFAGGDEAFLIGEADGLARTDCGVGGFEAGDSDDGGDNEVNFRESCDAHGAGRAVDDFDAGDSGVEEARGEMGGELLGGERDDAGAPAFALGEGGIDVTPGGERDDLIAIREAFADGEGAVADGAGRAE